MEQQPPKRTAVQRIDDLERGLMSMFQAGDNLARDIMTIKEAIKLLGSKVDAIVKATMAGEDLNDDVLSRIMIENNVVELRSRVSQLITSGMLVADEGPINENNFVVGREVDDEGKVLNPRLQFIVKSLEEKLREKIVGAKVGDSVAFQEGKLKFEIQEVYSVAAPQAPASEEAAPAPQDEASAPAPTEAESAPAEAPAAEQSSTDASNESSPQSSESSGS